MRNFLRIITYINQKFKMKKPYILALAWLLLWLPGCFAPVIERPDDPFEKKEPVPIVLDFDYRESNSASGYVQFINLSQGFQSWSWDFGFTYSSGQRATSQDARPYVFFPANGEYLVVLEGLDVNNTLHRTHKYIIIKNR